MDPTCQPLTFFFFFLFFLSLIFFRAARPAGPPPPAAPGPPPPASPSPPASSPAADGRGIPRTIDPISEAPDRLLPAPCRCIPAFTPPAPDPRPPARLRARASRPPAAVGEGRGRRWRSARVSGALPPLPQVAGAGRRTGARASGPPGRGRRSSRERLWASSALAAPPIPAQAPPVPAVTSIPAASELPNAWRKGERNGDDERRCARGTEPTHI